jgi:cytochrome bd-type quinol oxidase subunit 2
MIQQIVNRIALSVALVLALVMPLAAVTVSAQGVEDICQGVAITGGNCDDDASSTINSTVETVINLLSVVVGVVAVIMIIIGGFKYITSSGDSNNVSNAKNTILYAIIGLVVVALAQVIVIFVLDEVS